MEEKTNKANNDSTLEDALRSTIVNPETDSFTAMTDSAVIQYVMSNYGSKHTADETYSANLKLVEERK